MTRIIYKLRFETKGTSYIFEGDDTNWINLKG